MVESNQSPPLELTEDETVWSEDGNLILQCDNIAFRVYKGALSQRCEVMRDMFATCDTEGSQQSTETYKGCPVVRVHDKVLDMRRFLRYIMDRDYGADLKALDIDELASLIRLAKKYVYTALYDKVIVRLETFYPSNIDVFRIMMCEDDLAGSHSSELVAINLIFELDIKMPITFPVALFLCWRHDTIDVYRSLSPAAMEVLLRFQVYFDSRCLLYSGVLARASYYVCTCKAKICHERFPEYLVDQERSFQSRLRRWSFFAEQPEVHDMCHDCAVVLNERMADFQERLWDNVLMKYAFVHDGIDVDD